VRLIWLGALLEDHRTLRSYWFSDGTILYMSLAKKKPDAGPTRIGADPRSMAGFMESPIFGIFSKTFKDNHDAFLQLVENVPALSALTKSDPTLQHALDDEDFVQDQFSKMAGGTIAHTMDMALDGAERHPIGMSKFTREIERVYRGLKPKPTPIPTSLPADPLEPSDAPLPNSPFARTAAASSVVQGLRDELLRLQVLGVDLTRLPGMELLARACPTLDCAEVQRSFYRQFMQCKAYGFNDIEMISKALVASRGELNAAIALLTKRRMADARAAQPGKT
jgi:hypothetical protein